jgi:hypothetical protein
VDDGQLAVSPPAIVLPPEAPAEVQAVLDAYLVVREVVRLVDQHAEEIAFSYRFAEGRSDGLTMGQARDALRWLVSEGYLVEGTPLPPTKGHEYGPNTYLVGSRR